MFPASDYGAWDIGRPESRRGAGTRLAVRGNPSCGATTEPRTSPMPSQPIAQAVCWSGRESCGVRATQCLSRPANTGQPMPPPRTMRTTSISVAGHVDAGPRRRQTAEGGRCRCASACFGNGGPTFPHRRAGASVMPTRAGVRPTPTRRRTGPHTLAYRNERLDPVTNTRAPPSTRSARGRSHPPVHRGHCATMTARVDPTESPLVRPSAMHPALPDPPRHPIRLTVG